LRTYTSCSPQNRGRSSSPTHQSIPNLLSKKSHPEIIAPRSSSSSQALPLLDSAICPLRSLRMYHIPHPHTEVAAVCLCQGCRALSDRSRSGRSCARGRICSSTLEPRTWRNRFHFSHSRMSAPYGMHGLTTLHRVVCSYEQ
jgi:hypothetical protein